MRRFLFKNLETISPWGRDVSGCSGSLSIFAGGNPFPVHSIQTDICVPVLWAVGRNVEFDPTLQKKLSNQGM